MGNTCSCICRQTDEDEAANALLNSLDGQYPIHPRGPPPPYQAEAPFYAMSDEQRAQWVQRLTMIQCLPLGRYDMGNERKQKEVKLEPSEEVQGTEKKGEKDRECPICMVDFSTGEPIRLLPCMHFYHMRCIDDWLMRSYCCPTCMERVDVGMRETITAAATSHHPNLRRRRRRRRGERGSTSSTLSGASLGSVHTDSDRCSKERDNDSRQFLVPEAYDEQLTASAGQSSSGEHSCDLRHELDWTFEQSGPEGQHQNAVDQARHDVATTTTESETDHLKGTARQAENRSVEGMHGITLHKDMACGSHDASSVQGPPYSLDQIMKISNFEVDPQDPGLISDSLSPVDIPMSRSSPHPMPLSPPMFEYHFEFPLGLQRNHTSQ